MLKIKIIFLIVLSFYKLPLYKLNIFKQPKKLLELSKNNNNILIRHIELPKSRNQRIFLSSKFPTQIIIFSDSTIQFSADKIRDNYSNLEAQPSINNLLNLIKLAQSSLESKIINIFIYRLYNFNELQKELVEAASHDLNRDITVVTSFPISEQQKLQLRKVILEKIKVDGQVKFQITRDFSLGIELRDHCYTIFSNLDTCITELDKKAEIQGKEKNSHQKELILNRQVLEFGLKKRKNSQ